MKNTAIKENHLYRKVYEGGKKAYGKYTVIYVLKDKKAFLLRKQNPKKECVNRVGLTVTKKLGHAVVRNRIKRVIREAYAENERRFCIKKGNLIVICAREAAAYAKSTEICLEMTGQLIKLGLIEQEKSIPDASVPTEESN